MTEKILVVEDEPALQETFLHPRLPQSPTGTFSRFTALPIQIYNWTTRPQDQFRNIAAAAIIVLLIVLLSLNAAAILLRNRNSRRAT